MGISGLVFFPPTKAAKNKHVNMKLKKKELFTWKEVKEEESSRNLTDKCDISHRFTA